VNKRIVYTRHDGGVSVCAPTDWIMSVMSYGGLWDHLPPGVMDRQIASMVNRGINERTAYRYARAVMFGGCTTAEALEILRDRDCAPRGTGIELWDANDVPTDRWFRDAWRRSHNGGPISIDLEKARPVQWKRLKSAHTRRLNELTFRELDLESYRDKILTARDVMELRQVWPKELNQ
jgi:hypothetical protein